MTSRSSRHNSRSKPESQFQQSLQDDVQDFANLRLRSQRIVRKTEKEIEVVDDDEIKEVNPAVKVAKKNPFFGRFGFVDELARPPLHRKAKRVETVRDESSSEDEGLSSITRRERKDIKRAIRLSRQEEEKEKQKQLKLYENFSSSKVTTDADASSRKKSSVVIPSTDDEDLREMEPVLKDTKNSQSREGAESPELFPLQSIDCDDDEAEVEEFESSPTVVVNNKTSTSTSVVNSASKVAIQSDSPKAENVTDTTTIGVETQGSDSEPWLIADKVKSSRLKLKKKEGSQIKLESKLFNSKTMSSENEKCTKTGIKRKAVQVKTEPSDDDPPHKRRYITIESRWASEGTRDEPVVLVLDDDSSDGIDERSTEKPKTRSSVTHRRQPQIRFERCYKQTPPLPTTAKEAYKAGLYFAPPGVCSREYSPYIIRLFKKYSAKLHRAQSKVTTRIPWGNAVVCGPHEVNSLDYKALKLNKAKNDLECTTVVSVPVKPLNSRQRSLRSHSRSVDDGSHIVNSNSQEDLKSYLNDTSSTKTQNTWKNLLKIAEANVSVKENSVAVLSNKTESSFSNKEMVSDFDMDTGSSFGDVKKRVKTAINEIQLGSDTKEHELSMTNPDVIAKEKISTTKFNSCETFTGESLRKENVLETDENMKEAKVVSAVEEDSMPDSSPERKFRRVKTIKNLSSSSSDDSETELPAFNLLVPQDLKQKRESNTFAKTKQSGDIEIKSPSLDTDNILALSSRDTLSPNKSKSRIAELTKKNPSPRLAVSKDEKTETKPLQEVLPSVQRSEIKSKDRSPRSEMSAKLAAAAEFRIRKKNAESQDQSPSLVDLTESHPPNTDTQETSVTQQECPLCYIKFSKNEIMRHAADCNGLPVEEQPVSRSCETKALFRHILGKPLPKSPAREKLPELKVVLQRSPVVDIKAREKHFHMYDTNTARDLSSKVETPIPSSKANAVRVSSDDDSVFSGITSSSDLKPRRVLYAEQETEGSQLTAASETHRSLNKSKQNLPLSTTHKSSDKELCQQYGGNIFGCYDVALVPKGSGEAYEDYNPQTRNVQSRVKDADENVVNVNPCSEKKVFDSSTNVDSAKISVGKSKKRFPLGDENDRALDILGAAWSNPRSKRSRTHSGRAVKSRKRESDSESSDSDFEMCFLCSQRIPKADIEEHVEREIANRQRKTEGNYKEGISAEKMSKPKRTEAVARIHSASSDSGDDIPSSPIKTFQRISQQTDSCIEYDNQFDCFSDSSSSKKTNTKNYKGKVYGKRWGKGKWFRKGKRKK